MNLKFWVRKPPAERKVFAQRHPLTNPLAKLKDMGWSMSPDFFSPIMDDFSEKSTTYTSLNTVHLGSQVIGFEFFTRVGDRLFSIQFNPTGYKKPLVAIDVSKGRKRWYYTMECDSMRLLKQELGEEGGVVGEYD